MPQHKKYVWIFWKNSVYIQHVAVEGQATVGEIQGSIAATVVEMAR